MARISACIASRMVGKHWPMDLGESRMESPMVSVAQIMDCTWWACFSSQLRDEPTSFLGVIHASVCRKKSGLPLLSYSLARDSSHSNTLDSNVAQMVLEH